MKNEISITAATFFFVFDGRSIVCVYFHPQTSARTQPPNKVLSSAAMVAYFVYFGPRIMPPKKVLKLDGAQRTAVELID